MQKNNQSILQNIPRDAKILLAVSGGADSMAMWHYVKSLGYNVAIAHCNFGLRGAESDADAEFVEQSAKLFSEIFYVKRFDTLAYAKTNKLSVEEAARNLRYEWFEELRQQLDFEFIATAHHADDSIETFFINLTAGTGLRGLTGIKAQNNNIIRPILSWRKVDILKYCNVHKIEFRTDSTNLETNYLRNKFRLDILPKFVELNPNFRQTMTKNIEILSDVEKIYTQAIQIAKNQCLSKSKYWVEISISELLKTVTPKTFLFEFLREFGFNPTTSELILENLNQQSGKQYFSETHRLIRDREALLISEIEPYEISERFVQVSDIEIDTPLKLRFSFIENNSDFKFNRDSNFAFFDAEKISFPLKIRQIHEGDAFVPFGMKGKKNVSDLLIDLKINRFQKEHCFVMTTNETILWLVGLRSDDRFKITSETKKILKVEYLA